MLRLAWADEKKRLHEDNTKMFSKHNKWHFGYLRENFSIAYIYPVQKISEGVRLIMMVIFRF